FTHVVNGRFKGGYITRHYGEPSQDIDAIQLELAQRNYMDEDSFEYRDDIAIETQRVLRTLLDACFG
ncbi:MAG TPA: N-formylglutamate amidohydrolase, partial [Rhodanobacteraceae bacterium]|nr:N-formylglutamate amidohydrolase [Rhodanobacteraceae bacterium]